MLKKPIIIILTFLLIISVFFQVISLISQDTKGTDIPGGHISIDTTWTSANSPYIIYGDVVVDSGVNLIIEPGVSVKFTGDYSLYIEGNLNALGNTANRITFTSDTAGPPKRGDWESIRVNATGHLKMNYCDISYADNAVYLYGASDNLIENSSVSESRRHGIYARYSSYTKIKNSDIGPNNWNGIYFLSSTNAEVSNCAIHSNSFEGISISDSSFVAPIHLHNLLKRFCYPQTDSMPL